MLKNFEFALLMLLFLIGIFKKTFQIFLLKKFCILCCDSWEFFEPESTFIYRGHANIIIVLRKEK